MPQLCSFGSISGPSAVGHSSHGSSAEPHFAQHLEIGTEAGADDHLIDIDAELRRLRSRPSCCSASPLLAIERMRYGVSTRIGPASTARFARCPSSPRASSASDAPPPHTDSRLSRRIAQMNARARRFIGEREQIEDDVERGVAAADDEDALAGVSPPLAAGHVGNAVGNAIAMCALRRRRRRRPSPPDSGAARCRWHRSPRAPRSSRRSRAGSRTAARSRPLVRTLSKSLRPTDVDARVDSGRAAGSPDDPTAASRIDRSARGRSADGPRPATTSRLIRAGSSPRHRPCIATARTCARGPIPARRPRLHAPLRARQTAADKREDARRRPDRPAPRQ